MLFKLLFARLLFFIIALNGLTAHAATRKKPEPVKITLPILRGPLTNEWTGVVPDFDSGRFSVRDIMSAISYREEYSSDPSGQLMVLLGFTISHPLATPDLSIHELEQSDYEHLCAAIEERVEFSRLNLLRQFPIFSDFEFPDLTDNPELLEIWLKEMERSLKAKKAVVYRDPPTFKSVH